MLRVGDMPRERDLVLERVVLDEDEFSFARKERHVAKHQPIDRQSSQLGGKKKEKRSNLEKIQLNAQI